MSIILNVASLNSYVGVDVVAAFLTALASLRRPLLCRMLICASQAGSLIGKSGVTIKELKEQSGCSNIKVLQPDDLPPCGLSTDKLLHITGPPESLRRVLQLASTRLRDSPPKEPPSHEPCKNAYPPAPPMGAPPPGYMGGPPPGYMPPPPGAAGAPGAPQY